MAKPLIMVVDDEKDIADSLSGAIRDTGKYEVVTANSAKDAADLLAKNKQLMGLIPNRIRLILLDVKMPGMDGLEFLKNIRKEYQEKIGVIIVTAWEDEEKWEKARQGFAAGYIRKPFDINNVLGHLEEFFSGHQEHMIELTNQRTHAQEFAKRLRNTFNVERIREKIRKEEEEENG